jgi:Flp pilus assembly pilin Flp
MQLIGRVQPAQEPDMISIRRLTKREDGQDLLEYGLLATLIAMFAMGGIKLVSDTVGKVLWASIAINF